MKKSYIPSSILNNGKCIAESITIAKIFNYYIFSFSCTCKQIKDFSCKSFKDYLLYKNHDSFSLITKSKAEIDAIISSLNSNKSTNPNSIPLKIPKLTQNELSIICKYELSIISKK